MKAARFGWDLEWTIFIQRHCGLDWSNVVFSAITRQPQDLFPPPKYGFPYQGQAFVAKSGGGTRRSAFPRRRSFSSKTTIRSRQPARVTAALSNLSRALPRYHGLLLLDHGHHYCSTAKNWRVQSLSLFCGIGDGSRGDGIRKVALNLLPFYRLRGGKH